ncbi:hypothetical protein DFP93_105112 [Aneurinibacillus soli]|uniref:Uncharacterized protein n=1 Tax=Aneurinibacillus soli TaxID=1500254 RepID=A0A0U5BKD0_9BACL|nr:hypothetical protein DFP93_105112 [Aneurinibacillus soli]BAU28654.1 hypothetical protein CB4_02829 [Aneurinibacillus soli]
MQVKNKEAVFRKASYDQANPLWHRVFFCKPKHCAGSGRMEEQESAFT